MCGICGIAPADKLPVERRQLEAMNACLHHRGPDGDGFYTSEGVGLAMRRLAIIDVAGGDQPIANEDETLWIVYNGESYNYPALRAELEARGHHFRTQTDTECILHLYEDFGDDCASHLRGQAAFALWDEKQKRVLLARDRLGQKPLYYTVQDDTLYFASELPALLRVLPHTPDIHLPAIDLYLSLQYVPEPLTPYEGIFKLPPAHRAVWQNGELSIERYWQLEYEPKHTDSEQDLIVELGARLRQAVYMRLISEVPLGAHLSGGIDSSIIVALMSEKTSGPVKTFSVGFEETNFSELPYARAVAERYATDHHEFTLSFGDIPATLEHVLSHVGEPFADPSALPLYHLSRLTREHVTVALNGDGGDEAFAGYQRYWLDPLANNYLKLPGFVTRGLVPAFANLLPDRADRPVGGSLVNGLKRLEQLPAIDRRASILRWGSYFSPQHRAGLWQSEYQYALDMQGPESYLGTHFDSPYANSFMDRTLYTDIHSYLPGDLLVKADRMTMAHSVEGRSPFLDHEVMAWAARLPENLKVRGRTGKYLLRKTFADLLPDGITGRGKQGFGIPIGAWLRGPLGDWARELLYSSPGITTWFRRTAIEELFEQHQKGQYDHGKRLWALACLALWAQPLHIKK
ncbi:MAG: asparagine synthase (glutamine-hydrolyzing) [Chloroflexi bacterium]|nr:MAG: asparagine synthase (glutamine-hydrolyzing) [Chloroflexota bacterium]MBL1193207.1 asparagine synthase (glutamine-hydrolyzing) [Chloroflexota bacterium]NOH10501.1 asparagine synthase (glutamine-hydrolyzing) [Chloroflexota bacterium]